MKIFAQIYNAKCEEAFFILLGSWVTWGLKLRSFLYATSRINCQVQKAALTFKKHLAGIKNWIKSKINNGISEGLNSIVQAAKRKARGYGKKHFSIIALLLIGKLDFTKVNPPILGKSLKTIVTSS